MKVAEYRQLQAQSMSEEQFQSHVVALASSLGWLWHHHYDSRRSTPGWPDLVLVRGRTALFRELKTSSGVVTKAQHVWIEGLTAAGLDAGVWRPRHLMDRTIEKELRR